MFVDDLRRAVEASPRVELTKVSALLWKAYAAGQVSEAEASALSEAIEARRALPAAPKPVQRRLGSRPRSPRQHGATPAVGRFGRPPAGSRGAVHPSRDGRLGRDRGR